MTKNNKIEQTKITTDIEMTFETSEERNKDRDVSMKFVKSPLPRDRTFEALIINKNDVSIKFVRYVSAKEIKQLSVFNNYEDDDWCGTFMSLGKDGRPSVEIEHKQFSKWRELTL